MGFEHWLKTYLSEHVVGKHKSDLMSECTCGCLALGSRLFCNMDRRLAGDELMQLLMNYSRWSYKYPFSREKAQRRSKQLQTNDPQVTDTRNEILLS